MGVVIGQTPRFCFDYHLEALAYNRKGGERLESRDPAGAVIIAMAKASKNGSSQDGLQATACPSAVTVATVEQYAYTLIQKYYHRLISRETLVLKDKDPEDLHQMRVAIRRLQTALQIFEAAIVLPKAAQIKALQAVTKRLGKLRDLDVQLDTLNTDYADKLDPSEHRLLAQAIAVLSKHRKKAFDQVKAVLKGETYQALKAAYEDWLVRPQYTLVAQQAVQLVLPELLSPLLSELLLHPGWLIAPDDRAAIASPTLHDLRKTCKHVRYQAEFFTDFYEPAFKDWVEEIKGLQDSLGTVHDIQVLQQILIKSVPEWAESIHLRQMIEEQHELALGLWRSVQAKYLSPDYRLYLHQLILSPLVPLRSQTLGVRDAVEGTALTTASTQSSASDSAIPTELAVEITDSSDSTHNAHKQDANSVAESSVPPVEQPPTTGPKRRRTVSTVKKTVISKTVTSRTPRSRPSARAQSRENASEK